MEFETFKSLCEKKVCLRHTSISKECLKVYKQEKCFRRFNVKIVKDISEGENSEKIKNKELYKFVLQRDKICQITQILTKKEKLFILENYLEEFNTLKHILDPAHIISRSQAPELKFDTSNVVLVNRYFHSLLDELKHPVYKTRITSEERLKWFQAAKNLNRDLLN